MAHWHSVNEFPPEHTYLVLVIDTGQDGYAVVAPVTFTQVTGYWQNDGLRFEPLGIKMWTPMSEGLDNVRDSLALDLQAP
jgi:hypothetical protein